MHAKTLHIQLITPERVVYKAEGVRQITVPTAMGEITVLPHHVPLVATLAHGEMHIVESDGKDRVFACSGGFIEIKHNGEVVLLADNAERAEEIDEARAETARKRAEETMKEKAANTVEYAAISTKLERELARLRVVRKHRGSHASVPPVSTT